MDLRVYAVDGQFVNELIEKRLVSCEELKYGGFQLAFVVLQFISSDHHRKTRSFPEAKFLDEILTKVLRVFLLAIYLHLRILL